jgi:hypothetical protein
MNQNNFVNCTMREKIVKVFFVFTISNLNDLHWGFDLFKIYHDMFVNVAANEASAWTCSTRKKNLCGYDAYSV